MDTSRKPMESEWERSQNLHKKNIITRFFLILPIALVIGILIVNNRDLISGGQTVDESDFTSDSILGDPDQIEENEMHPYSHDINKEKTDATRKLIAENAEKTAAPEKKSDTDAKTVETKNNVTSAGQRKILKKKPALINHDSFSEKPAASLNKTEFNEPSVELPPFQCSIENRKDIVISLSLELFYKDSTFRSAILFRRNEIKVMIMRVIRKKVLSEMKITVLEKELMKDINSIFDRPTVSQLKIRNIQIEKVSTK